MKKQVFTALFALILCLVPAMTVFAQTPIPEERALPRLVDQGNLLSGSEEAKLLDKLDEISERQQCDVAVVTVDSLEGRTATAYADDFYDYNGYGQGNGDDGILLLVSIGDREWAISTYGYGITAFTDAGQSYMTDQFLPFLSDGDYYQAFDTFASLCDEFLTQAKSGEPYDSGNLPKGT
ncbi:MAG: TPM domain-containing protein, partial [Clostridiales bacterium]|nr:TPM domain-containing protein [Clostridiales bacterium]